MARQNILVFDNRPFGGFVFLEGLDKTGKTTLARRCRFEAKPAHPCFFIDRGFVGRHVFYAVRKELDFPIERWAEKEAMLNQHNIYMVVWLKASVKEVRRRIEAAGEQHEFTEAQLQDQHSRYAMLMAMRKRMGVPILEINTEVMSEDQSVQKILDWTGFNKEVHDAVDKSRRP